MEEVKTDEAELDNIAKMFKLSTDDITKMHHFVIQAKNSGDNWPILLDNYELTENQKLFISYIKGVSKGTQVAEKRITQRMKNVKNAKKIKLDKFDTFIDQIDAFEHISHGFNGWNTEEGIRVLVSCIETIMLASLPKELIPSISMLLSDTFCRFADDYKHMNNDNIIKKNKK